MMADVAFYVELARQADGPLVEWRSGRRVAIRGAGDWQRRWHRPSPEKPRSAGPCGEAGVELDLREGDMRDSPSTSRRR